MKETSLTQKLILVSFSVLCTIVVIELGLRIGGMLFLSKQEQRNVNSIQRQAAFRILCLGESTTALGGEDSYPRQLERVLNDQGLNIQFSVINKGIPRITTEHILSQLDFYLNRYEPDMIITMMGINDGDSGISKKDSRYGKYFHFIQSLQVYKLMKYMNERIQLKFKEVNKGAGLADIDLKDLDNSGPAFPMVELLMLSEKYEQALPLLHKLLKVYPNDKKLLYQLAVCYRHERLIDKAQQILRKLLEVNPHNDAALYELGWCVGEREEYKQAAKFFAQAIELSPKQSKYYGSLAWSHRQRGNFRQAKQLYEQALKYDSNDAWVQEEIGWNYYDQGQYRKAVPFFKKALELNPAHGLLYALAMARTYERLGEYDRAVNVLEAQVKDYPKHTGLLYLLEDLYKKQGKYSDAERIIKQAIEKSPDKDELYGRLAQFYLEQDKLDLAEQYFAKAKQLRTQFYNPITRKNYQRLADIILRRGKSLVCVQYPLRSIQPLKNLLDRNDVIFVDNEMIFKRLVIKEGYDTYFSDRFAGDFGHLNSKGNKVLAENIVQVILKEYFYPFLGR